ncbi:hypothetical protein RvY_09757 [Ramazzottius varieornatus]|uniref:Uncharacterized protein n=1 Tax=Ramazzottius varieornatus TaxID=947166 RepID=A0A1D1VJG5_RAMVA|nr:hypothetical protein RvY_09757 [Ramazzottius varieornatus]
MADDSKTSEHVSTTTVNLTTEAVEEEAADQSGTLLVEGMTSKKLFFVATDAFLGILGVDKSTLINCLGHFAMFTGHVLAVRRLDDQESHCSEDPYLRETFVQFLKILLHSFRTIRRLIIIHATLKPEDVVELGQGASFSNLGIELRDCRLLVSASPHSAPPFLHNYCTNQIFKQRKACPISKQLESFMEKAMAQHPADELDRQRHSERLKHILDCQPPCK